MFIKMIYEGEIGEGFEIIVYTIVTHRKAGISYESLQMNARRVFPSAKQGTKESNEAEAWTRSFTPRI